MRPDPDDAPDGSAHGPPPGPIRRRLSAIPPLLWLISALWGSLLLGASVLWPMSYGYDEPVHVDMAYVYSAHPFHWYGPGELPLTKAEMGMRKSVPGYPPKERLADAPIPPRGQRPSLTALGGHAFANGSGPNQMVQHPPLYYWLGAGVLGLPGVSHQGWDFEVWLMRLVSVVLLLPLPALCWAATRRLLVAQRPTAVASLDVASKWALLAAVIPLTVPNLIRDGSTVNNDALLILTTSALLYLLVRVLTGDLSRRTAIWVGVNLAAALLTKGFALVLPPIVLAAYLVGAWRAGAGAAARLRALWPSLAIAAAGGVVGGLWWLRNLIDYGTVQVSGFGPAYDALLYGQRDNRGTFSHFVPLFTTDFVSRIWGGVGLPDAPSPGPFIIYGWFFVVLLGLVAALLVAGNPGRRLRTAVLVSVPVLTVLVVAQGSLSTFEHWSTSTHGSQGRYLYHTVVAVAALATIGWFELLQPRFRALLVPATLIGAVLTNAAVWLLLLRSWYQPVSASSSSLASLRAAVRGLLRWSPLPPPLTLLLVGGLPAVASVAAVVASVRDARTTTSNGGAAGQGHIAADEDYPRGDHYRQGLTRGQDDGKHEGEHDVADAGARRRRDEQHAE